MSVALPIKEDPRFRRYTASAGQTVFSIPFPFQQADDISIQLFSDGKYTEIDRSAFNITGEMNPVGGSVTFNVGRSVGDIIVVAGATILERLSSIVRDGRFASKLTDDELDRNRIIQQEQQRDISRSIKAPYGNKGATLSASSPSALLHIDGNGNIVESETPVNEKTQREIGDKAIASLIGQAGKIEVPFYDTRIAASFANIKSTIHAIEVGGDELPGDGHGGLFVDENTGSDETFISEDGRTWYRVPDVGPKRIAAQVAVRMIEFDLRSSDFSGGARWNDIDDDTPTLVAAVEYFNTLGGLNQYEGKNSARLRLPRGIGRVSGLDVTTANNVHFIGEGDGTTTLRNTENAPCISSKNVAGTNDAFRTRYEGFCIIGPGRSYENAHGLDLGALNNGAIIDVRVYSCRDAIRLRNNWQTDLVRFKVDGGPSVGALSCYNGICLLDGLDEVGTSNSVVENAVKIHGGIVSGCEMYGFRGESVSGSMVIGLEVLACNGIGVYLGDNPGGKDLKWFTWTGGMIDTCRDLLRINRGGATFAGQVHFSGFWLGYASEGGGNGIAMELNNIVDSTFRPDLILNSDIALLANFCDGVVFEPGLIEGYDRSHVGAIPVQAANTSRSNLIVRRARKSVGSPTADVVVEVGTSDFNFIDVTNADGGAIVIGPNTILRGSRAAKTKTHGLATIPAGTSTVTVNHLLCRTPQAGEIQVTPIHLLSSVGAQAYAVESITSGSFTIRINASASAAIDFAWMGDVSRG